MTLQPCGRLKFRVRRFLPPLLLPLALALALLLLLLAPGPEPEPWRSAPPELVPKGTAASEGPTLSTVPPSGLGHRAGPREDAQPGVTRTYHLLITRNDDKSPIPGARVTIVRTDAPLRPLGPAVTSDAAGRVTLVTTTASDGLTFVVRADGFAANGDHTTWGNVPSRPTVVRMTKRQELRGLVLDALTDAPIAGARIQLRDGPLVLLHNDTSLSPGLERGLTRSAADGSYGLDDVRDWSIMQVSAQGYASAWIWVFGLAEARRDGGRVLLLPASRLRGQLVDAQGEPVEGATLYLAPFGFHHALTSSSKQDVWMARTLRGRGFFAIGGRRMISQEPGLEDLYVRRSAVSDAHGHFEFTGLAHRAKYDLSTVSDGSVSDSSMSDSSMVALAAGIQGGPGPRLRLRLPAPVPIADGSIEEGAVEDGTDVDAPPAGELPSIEETADAYVRGTVLDERGHPLEGVRVVVDHAQTRELRTGPDGTFGVRLPGRFLPRIRARLEGYHPEECSGWKYQQKPVRIQLEPELRLRIPISVPLGIEPPKFVSARLKAIGSSSQVEHSWKTIREAGGTFVVTARRSHVTVAFSAPGFLPTERRVDSGARTGGALPAVVLDPGCTLSLRVLDSYGTAVEGAEVGVGVRGEASSNYGAPDTDAAGVTRATGLPPGATVVVSCLSQEHGAAEATWTLRGRNDTHTLQLVPFGLVRGQILDLQGAPIDRAEVSAYRLGPGAEHEYMGRSLTGHAGTFRLRLGPGRHRLELRQASEHEGTAMREVQVQSDRTQEMIIRVPRR